MSLQTKEEIADALNLTQEIAADVALSDRIQRLANVATNLIERHCHRFFEPRVGVILFYDAPYNTKFGLPDIISITSLKLFGDPLVQGNPGYHILPDQYGLGVNALQRVDAEGIPIQWSLNEANPDASLAGALEITYNAGWNPLPDDAVIACEMVACNLYNTRKRQWAESSGGPVIGRESGRSEAGFLTRTVRDLLIPYVVPDLYQITPELIYDPDTV